MNNRALAEDEGPAGSCSRRDADRFRRTISGLETSWRAEAARAPFYPFIAWTPEGARLGAATLLKRNGRSEDDRLLALLSMAHARDIPAGALKHLVWAEREFHRGDLLKSAMHVALTGLPALVGSEAARRLHIAAGMLDHGLHTPLGLMEACGFDCGPLDALLKYDPDQSRAPKGSPDGGQWTRDGTGDPSDHTSHDPAIQETPREVAVLTGELKHACRALGLDYNAASDILHALKKKAGLSGADNCTFDTETGDVFYGDEWIGSLVE
ncbi:MAG TPA: hypothetical protein VLI91_00470 [Roseiarcus sp.]|nr:hypothetical protein [Roseiarcus sp.]